MSIQHDMNEIIVVEQPSSSVATRIKDRLGTISSSFPKPTIFKVHTMLRRENEMAYEPNVLAIGPYHRGKDRLQVMEDRKLRWFKANLEKLEESDPTKYVEAMRKLEPEARQCYSESTDDIKEDEFVEMLLLDACFIIQFMRWYLKLNTSDTFWHLKLNTSDSFFQDWIEYSLIDDMLMFENQIPLFVVQELYSMIKLPQEPTHFHDLALIFLTQSLGDMFSIPNATRGYLLSLSHDNDTKHILELSHYILRSAAVNNDHKHRDETNKAKWTSQLCETAGFKFINKQLRRLGWFDQHNSDDDGMKFESIPSASKLHIAGVEFKRMKVTCNPFEINFKNGVMEIPIFNIGDGTECLYRNLIAYEQYNQKPINRCVGLHAKLMDCLVDSADDVSVLRRSGIVDSYLGEDEAISSMFNKLVNEVCVTNLHAKIFEEVNAYYGKRRLRWITLIRSDYFNNPLWGFISFLAAFVVLLLTVIQTVFSILGGV